MTVQLMCRQLVVTGLDRFETLCHFAGWNDNDHRRKPSSLQSSRSSFRIVRCHVAVRDDGASTPELQSGALFAKSLEESRGDLNLIAASPKGHIDGPHSLRIGMTARL